MTINKLKRGQRFMVADWPNRTGKLLDKTRGAAAGTPVTISLGTIVTTQEETGS